MFLAGTHLPNCYKAFKFQKEKLINKEEEIYHLSTAHWILGNKKGNKFLYNFK